MQINMCKLREFKSIYQGKTNNGISYRKARERENVLLTPIHLHLVQRNKMRSEIIERYD